MQTYGFILILFFSFTILAASGTNETDAKPETKKTYLEDIFIWKMSDELKLTAQEEKKFTEIHKNLNKQKAEFNRQIQEKIEALGRANQSDDKVIEADLKKLRKLMVDYNQLTLKEFDSVKELVGAKKFLSYLQIKADLTSKVKNLISGEKPVEKSKKEAAPVKLPPPQIIIEKNE